MKQRIIIVGGGLAGLSTAYHLAKTGTAEVIVLEREIRIGAHASGNNAGMIRQTVSDPVLAGLAAEGRKKLSALKGLRWKKLKFESSGSLLLSDRNENELDRILKTTGKNQVPCRSVKKETVSRKVPALGNASYRRAIFCPTDALVDVGGLLEGLQKELKRLGVRILLGHPLHSVRNSEGSFILSSGNREFFADKIVNAAGAWAGEVAKIAGASRPPLKPYLRHLYESRGFGSDSTRWPFVWHLDRGIYFRPIPKGILASPCDKRFVRLEKTVQKETARLADQKTRESLRVKLEKFSPSFKSIKLAAQRTGLRTMAPDGRFVIGEDPSLKKFYWVAGLGGHGVTTSFAVGDLAARLVLGKKTNAQKVRWASAGRFVKR